MFMDEVDISCMLCAEDIGDGLLPAFGECNHRGVCSICFTRMRSLLRDFSCPVCKKDLDKVVCSSTVQDFQDLSIWGTDAGAMFLFDEKAKMFFPRKYHRDKIAPLWLSKCPVCDVVKRDATELRKHVQSTHNLMMCQLCIDHLQSFPAEFKIYAMKEYENHLKCADRAGSQGHPSCEFCRKRYYDKNALFMHLHVDHFTCHICEKNGIKFKYYQNYKSLESHFRKDHCICEDQSCLQKRFTVFSSEIELTSHRMTWHPTLQLSRHIPVTFRSYRDRQDSRYSGIEEPAVLAHDGGERRRRPGEFDGGIAGIATNGEWQIELQNPTAGANRGRTGPAGYSLPAPPVAHASGVAPPIPPPTGPEPRWPGANNNANSIDDFPGLSGKKGGTSQSAMLGNWGKAAGAKSVRPEVIKPKSNPKDRNIHAPKPASAAPNSTKPATIQSNSIATPALKRGELPEPVAAKSLQSSEQSKEAQTKSIEKALEKNSISEPNYLSNIAYDISDSRSIINNMGSVDEYPRLSKPAAPVTSTNFQDKNAYPALPMPSGTGKEKNKKNAVESHVDHASILKKSSSISASISNPSTANLVATAAGFEPIQAKPHPKPFKNTVGDADEYPALPAKKKKSTKGGVNIPTTTDDSAVAFRSIRASVLGTKSPASTVSPAAAGAIFGSEHPQHAMESQSDYDYPPLFTPFRIGVPLSTNPTGIGKGKNSGKVSAKKQQKADLRMLAFNMK